MFRQYRKELRMHHYNGRRSAYSYAPEFMRMQAIMRWHACSAHEFKEEYRDSGRLRVRSDFPRNVAISTYYGWIRLTSGRPYGYICTDTCLLRGIEVRDGYHHRAKTLIVGAFIEIRGLGA